MDQLTRQFFTDVHSQDRDRRYEAYQYLLKETQEPVGWAYEVWEELLTLLSQGDNHERSIAAQLLSNLAKSDPERRIVRDIDKLILVTKDERFVTARHTLQSLWKIGVVDLVLQELVCQKLEARFKECASEKNATLIRYDIIVNFNKMYQQFQDETVKQRAMMLIGLEADPKYQKKYSAVWKR